jgi:chromosomal replication initiator protein
LRPPRRWRYPTPLNERYTFDRFVVGNNNQLAAAAAHAVAEAPARMYNPLFIYGGVGLGKTHLMHAIGHAVLEREPGKRVSTSPPSASPTSWWRDPGRDDGGVPPPVPADRPAAGGRHPVPGGEGADAGGVLPHLQRLHDAQRQIVLTSDRPPKEIGLEDRLVSRFEWGLVTDIKPPDFETRVAILRKKVEEDGLEIRGWRRCSTSSRSTAPPRCARSRAR